MKRPTKTLNSATKPEKPGKPTDVRPAIDEEHGEPRHLAREAAEDRQLARVGLVVDGADHGEHEGGHDAVREHLQRGAVDADRVERRQAHEHVAHVADGRVADDVLEVGLGHGRDRAVEDVDRCRG